MCKINSSAKIILLINEELSHKIPYDTRAVGPGADSLRVVGRHLYGGHGALVLLQHFLQALAFWLYVPDSDLDTIVNSIYVSDERSCESSSLIIVVIYFTYRVVTAKSNLTLYMSLQNGKSIKNLEASIHCSKIFIISNQR